MQSALPIEHRILLSTDLAGGRQAKFALAAVLVSAVFFFATVLFAKTPLAHLAAFIPAYLAALVVSDLITAILLFGQFNVSQSKALLVLASGYLFTASIAFSQMLIFPGAFSPTGLLGTGPQSAPWLWTVWHCGFPLVIVLYVLVSEKERHKISTAEVSGLPRHRYGFAILIGVVTAFAASGLTLVATAHQYSLPELIVNGRYTLLANIVSDSTWFLSFIALAALWWRRPHTVLDLWLMVVMCAWLFDIALCTVFNAARFDVGWYAGRICGLLAATFVLVMLLLETATLYAQLVDLLGVEQQKRSRLADRQRRLFDTSLDLILITDRHGRFIEVSSSSMATLGYRPVEMTGRVGSAFLHLDDLKRTRNEMRLARRGQLMRNFEARYLHKDGRVVTLAWNGVWSKSEQLHFFIGRDVTEAKLAERLKNEFIATVSHELRTPLTAIIGFLGLVTGVGIERIADPMRVLNLAYANSQRLLRLVNDILDVETIEGDRVVFDFQQVELKPLVEEAIEANRVYAETFKVVVRLDDRADDATIHTDANRLTQVVANLLSNAVKFSPYGQEVAVTIEALDDRVRVAVRDHGRGIPDEFKTRIFEKFVQIEASDARERGGTGIGLSIVKQLMSRLGGDVSHIAAQGGGTIFRVDLPHGITKTFVNESGHQLATD
jgi:PAS domain S-box-containing protein